MVEVIPFLRIFNLLNLSNVLSKRNKREPIENNDLSVEFLDQSLSTGQDSIANVYNFYQNEFIDGVEGFDDPSTLETYLHDYETCLEVSETYYTFNCSYYRNYYDSDQIRGHARIAVTAGHHQLPENLEQLCDSYKILTSCYDVFKEKPKEERNVAANKVKVQCFYTCNCPMTCLDAIDVDALIRNDGSKKKRRKLREGDLEQVDLLAADLSDKLKQIQELKRKKKNKKAREKERKEREAEMKRAEEERVVSDFFKGFENNQGSCETSARKLEPSAELPEAGVLQRDPAIADIKHGSEYVESIKKIVEKKKALRKNSGKVEIIEETQEEGLELRNLPTSPVPSVFSFVSAPVQWYSRPTPRHLDLQRHFKQIPASLTYGTEWFERFGIFQMAVQAMFNLPYLMQEFPQWHHLAHGFRREILVRTEENEPPDEPDRDVENLQEKKLQIMGLFQKLAADCTRYYPFKELMQDIESDVITKLLPTPDQDSPEADTIDSDDEVQTIASHEPLQIFLELVSEVCTIINSMNGRSTRNDNWTAEQEVDAAQETRPTTERDTAFDQLRRRLSMRGSKNGAFSRKRKYEDVEGCASVGTQPDIVSNFETGQLETAVKNHLPLPRNDRFEETEQNRRSARRQPLLGHLYVEDHHQGGSLIPISVRNIRNRITSLSRRVHERVLAEYIPSIELTDRLYADRFPRRTRIIITDIQRNVNESRTVVFHPMVIKLLECFRRFGINQSIGLQRNVNESRTVVFHPLVIKLFDCIRRFGINQSTGLQRNAVSPLIEIVEINRPEPYHSMEVLPRSNRAVVEYIDWSVELRNRTNLRSRVVVVNGTVLFHPVIIKLFESFRRFGINQSTGLQRNVVIPLIEIVGINRPDPYHSMAVLLRSDRALVKYVDWSVELRNRTNIPTTAIDVNESRTISFHPLVIKLFGFFHRFARNRSTSVQRNVEMNRPEPYHSMAVLLRSNRALVKYVDWSVELRNIINIPTTPIDVNESRTILFHPMVTKLFGFFRRFARSTSLQRNVEINRPEPYHSMAVLLRSDRALVKYIDWSEELRNRINIPTTAIDVNESRTISFHPIVIKLFGFFRRFARNPSTSVQRNVEINRPEPYHSMAVLLRSDRALVKYIDWSVELRNRINIPTTVIDVNESRTISFHPMVTKLFGFFRRFARNPSTSVQRNVEINRPEPYHSMAVLLRSDRALVNYVDWSVELRNRTNIPTTAIDVNGSRTISFHPLVIKLFGFFHRFAINRSTSVQRNVEMNRPEPYHSMAVLLRSDRVLVKYIDWSVELRYIINIPTTAIDVNGSRTISFHPMVMKLFGFFRRFARNRSTRLQRNVKMNRPEPYHSMAVLLRSDRALVKYIDWSVELRNRINIPTTAIDVNESRTISFHPMVIKLFGFFRRFARNQSTSVQRNVEINRPEPYHSMAVLLRSDRALVKYVDWSEELRNRINIPTTAIDMNESRTISFHPMVTKLFGFFRRFARNPSTSVQRNVEMNRPEPYHSMAVLLKSDRALVKYIDWSVELRNRINIPTTAIDLNESRTISFHPMVIKLFGFFRRFARNRSTSLQRNVEVNRPEPYHSMAVLLRSDRALVKYIDWSVELRNRINIPTTAIDVNESRTISFHPMVIKLFGFFRRFARNQSTSLQSNVVIPLTEIVGIDRPEPYHSMAVLQRSDRALVKYINWSVELRNRSNILSIVVNVIESRIVVFHPVLIEQLVYFRRFIIRNTEERQRHFVEPRRDQALVEYKSTNFTDLVELDGNEHRRVVLKIGIDWKYEDLPDSLRNNFTKSEFLEFVKYARLFESKNCEKMIQFDDNNRPEPYHSKAVLLKDDRALVEYKDWSVEFRNRTNIRRIVVDQSRIVVLHPVMIEILDRFRRFTLSTSQKNVANPRRDRALVPYTDWPVEFRNRTKTLMRIVMVHLLSLYLFHFLNKSPPKTTRKRNSDLEEIDEIASSTRVDQTITVPIERNNIGIRDDPSVRNVPQTNGVIKQNSVETRPASTEFERYLEDYVCGLWNIGETDGDVVRFVKRCGTFLILIYVLDKAVYLLDLLCIDVVFLIVLFIYLCVQFVIHA